MFKTMKRALLFFDLKIVEALDGFRIALNESKRYESSDEDNADNNVIDNELPGLGSEAGYHVTRHQQPGTHEPNADSTCSNHRHRHHHKIITLNIAFKM